MVVRDIMTSEVVTVNQATSVKDIAQKLVAHAIKGMPVVDEAMRVLGIVTECDLILQNAKLHIPTFIQILDGIITLGEKQTEDELHKMMGAVASDMMSSPAICVTPETSIADLATLMWEKKINPVPVVEDERLVGIVSRADIVRLLAQN